MALPAAAPLSAVRSLPGFTTASAIAAAAELDGPGAASRLELSHEFAGLLPLGRLKPGSCVGIGGGPGQTALLLRLLAGPMEHGCWAAVIGMPDLGIAAAMELGVKLDHLALVPEPGQQWLEVAAALLDSVELVVLNPPGTIRASDAKRLMARARQRQSVLVVLNGERRGGLTGGGTRTVWPEQPDVVLLAQAADCTGVARGHGSLRARQIRVTTGGRRTGLPKSTRIRADRIEAEPLGQAELGQAEFRQAEPGQVEPRQTEPRQTEPRQTEPGQVALRQVELR